ncbi:MAG: DNA repair protein RecN [Oscillospiraceae bacterium]|nr:DNA repair protein RecN [Oscillospiraceae bacterium]
MLSGIHIENIALIKSADLLPAPGFTVLTGETGAGKSILIDSIGFLCGARTPRDIIRTGESGCLVSGVFDGVTGYVYDLLERSGIAATRDGQLELCRSMTSDGRSVCRVNGRVTTVSVLKEAASSLIVIHGQNESLALCDESKHIGYLDVYAEKLPDSDLSQLISEYRSAFSELTECEREIKSLTAREKGAAERAELLKYEINEISSARLKPGEEEELFARRERLVNAEKICSAVKLAIRAVNGAGAGKRGAAELLMLASAKLSELVSLVPEFGAVSESLMNLSYEASAAAESIAAICGEDIDDPSAELDKVESRIDIIYHLKLKYGENVGTVLSHLEENKAKLELLKSGAGKLSELEASRALIVSRVKDFAMKIHAVRERASRLLEKDITEKLSYLDMPKVGFCVSISPREKGGICAFDINGADDISFMIRTNAGEPFMPLSKIASGGELSRIMLSLQTVLTTAFDAGTMIFDEIDTGVSGKTSRKIGLSMRSLGAERQVLCVTHSAQVAGAADTHILVEKREDGGRTETVFKTLSDRERINELARILGGMNITENTVRSAGELLITEDGSGRQL